MDKATDAWRKAYGTVPETAAGRAIRHLEGQISQFGESLGGLLRPRLSKLESLSMIFALDTNLNRDMARTLREKLPSLEVAEDEDTPKDL